MAWLLISHQEHNIETKRTAFRVASRTEDWRMVVSYNKLAFVSPCFVSAARRKGSRRRIRNGPSKPSQSSLRHTAAAAPGPQPR